MKQINNVCTACTFLHKANVSMPGWAVLCWAGWCYNQTLDPRQVKLEAGHDTKITQTSCSATVTVQRDDKYRVDQKKVCSQKTKIGHGGGVLKKKSMTNKIKKFLYNIETFLFYWSWGFFQKKPTMADFRFLRTPFFLVHPVYISIHIYTSIATYLHQYLHIFTSIYISSPVSTYLHQYLHIYTNVFIHISTPVYAPVSTNLNQYTLVSAYLHQNLHI